MGFSPSSLRWSTCWCHYLRMDSHKPANKLPLSKLDGARENGLVFHVNWPSHSHCSSYLKKKIKSVPKKNMYFFQRKSRQPSRAPDWSMYWSGGCAVRGEFWRHIPSQTTNPKTTTPRHSQQRSVINIPHTLGSRQFSPAHTHTHTLWRRSASEPTWALASSV